MISKQKEIFNKLPNERLEEITTSNKNINTADLIYEYTDPAIDAKFNEFDNAINILNKIREGRISLADAKTDRAEF